MTMSNVWSPSSTNLMSHLNIDIDSMGPMVNITNLKCCLDWVCTHIVICVCLASQWVIKSNGSSYWVYLTNRNNLLWPLLSHPLLSRAAEVEEGWEKWHHCILLLRDQQDSYWIMAEEKEDLIASSNNEVWRYAGEFYLTVRKIEKEIDFLNNKHWWQVVGY